MSTENLTFESPAQSIDSWEAVDSILSGRSPELNSSPQQFVPSAPVLATCVVVVCFVASSVYLRHARSSPRCSGGRFRGKSQMQSENDDERLSGTRMQSLSTVQLALDPRWILRKCVSWCVAGPQVALEGIAREDKLTASTATSCERAPISGMHSSLAGRKVGRERQIRDGKIAMGRSPHHVAVIMDGHRRFGRAKYGDPLKGHSDGGKKLGQFLHWCMDAGVEIVTAFAFSTENWKRDEHEVTMLMDLVCKACGELMEDAVKNNLRIRVLSSDMTMLPERVVAAIQKAEHETRDCTGFLFNICLSYGARQEVANACRKIAEEVTSGVLPLHKVDEAAVKRNLLTGELPDPDILIRTSGEKRVSNFLLFQMAYTELFFVDKLWPEVTEEDVHRIFEEFNARERRYGC